MAEIVQIIWGDGPGGNVEHMAEHGVTPEEAEAVIRARFDSRDPSGTNPIYWVVDGFTPAKRALRIVFTSTTSTS